MSNLYAEFVDEKRSRTLKVGFCKKCVDMLYNFRVTGKVDIPEDTRIICQRVYTNFVDWYNTEVAIWTCTCGSDCSLKASPTDICKLIQCQERTRRLLALTEEETKAGIAQMYEQANKMKAEYERREKEQLERLEAQRLVNVLTNTCVNCRKWNGCDYYGRREKYICSTCEWGMIHANVHIMNIMKGVMYMCKQDKRERRNDRLDERKKFIMFILVEKKGVCKDVALMILSYAVGTPLRLNK